MTIELVPVLFEGPYDWDALKALAEGKTTVPGAEGIREGVVVRPQTERRAPGLGRVHLKLVSNQFLEKAE